MPLAYYHTVKPSLKTAEAVESLFSAICRTSVTEAFFTRLGEEAEQNITALAWELAGDDPTGEGYLDKAGRLGEARHRAEQIVLDEMILLPPEPGTSPASPR